MGNKTKTGKQRKDKFYRLAKETGFRSRAAFKLLQLNRKFSFLQSSRVLVDLCAAPGGWMQVAQQNMPVSSIVVGVDLYPIKPIPGCISITADITSDKCKVELTKALQTWKADVFLNDGAPNVGANWLFDAYQQSCLTLSALKVAVEFLREGGWFITKIFRSKDYNALLWVLKQLFQKVHATKPQASRNESAEIFVVCQHYKAPEKVDPKFFQPNYVFKELENNPDDKPNLFKPKKKVKAEGYDDNDYLLFRSIKAIEFVKSTNKVNKLQEASEIVIEDDFIGKSEKTTNEVRECCKDIRVLGRKELRMLLAWANSVKFPENPNNSRREGEGNASPPPEGINMDDVEKCVKSLQEEEKRMAKRKRKIAERERNKLNERMKLGMVLQGDEGPRLEEGDEMFNLRLIRSRQDLKKVSEQMPDNLAESDDDDDGAARPKRKAFDKDDTYLDSSGRFYKSDESEVEDNDENTDNDDDDNSKDGLGLSESDSEIVDESSQKQRNPLLTDLDQRERKEKRSGKVALWFEKDAFKNLETEMDEDYELDEVTRLVKQRGGKIKATETKSEVKTENPEDESSDDSAEEDEEDSFEVVPKGKDKKGKNNKRKLNEEGLAMGTVMVSSKKKKRDMIDDAWNRHAFNDDNLPDWFVEDEKKHMKRDVPVPAELVQDYKNNLKEINARPMKKVIEAKARKKRRSVKRMEKAKKKAESIMENPDASEREKARQIQKLYKKAQSNPRKELTYVVSKKHTAMKRVRRPLGVKGPYKVVDPRMKKDNRKKKNATKGNKGRGYARGKSSGRKK